MSLLDRVKQDKKAEPEQGTIPAGLGIKQSRANEIIDAVCASYIENKGDINKIIDEIKSEKMSENEAIFAYYAVGAIKVKLEMRARKDLEPVMELLEKMFGDK